MIVPLSAPGLVADRLQARFGVMFLNSVVHLPRRGSRTPALTPGLSAAPIRSMSAMRTKSSPRYHGLRDTGYGIRTTDYGLRTTCSAGCHAVASAHAVRTDATDPNRQSPIANRHVLYCPQHAPPPRPARHLRGSRGVVCRAVLCGSWSTPAVGKVSCA